MERSKKQGKQSTGLRQAVNAMRVRGLNAQSAFLSLGIHRYTAHVEAWAAMNGVRLPKDAKKRIQQVLNGNATSKDAEIIDAIERTIEQLNNAA